MAFLVILGVFGWLLFYRPVPLIELQRDETEQQSRALFNSLHIWRALNEFQKNRGTDTEPYPADIRQLDQIGITSDIGSLLELKRQFAGDWLYFSAADPENGNAPLLISPSLVNPSRRVGIKQHLVMTVDGSIQLLSPKETQKRIESSSTLPNRVHSNRD